MLRMKDILDEKDRRLRVVSKEVEFPLSEKDKETIGLMIEFLRNSQIPELSEKYDLRPGMGLSAIQLGIAKRYFLRSLNIDFEKSKNQLGGDIFLFGQFPQPFIKPLHP